MLFLTVSCPKCFADVGQSCGGLAYDVFHSERVGKFTISQVTETVAVPQVTETVVVPQVEGKKTETVNPQVNHPSHYNKHPSGVECITVVEHMTFNVGNAVKYLWRAGLKSNQTLLQDLQKARWYITREIERIEGIDRTTDKIKKE